MENLGKLKSILPYFLYRLPRETPDKAGLSQKPHVKQTKITQTTINQIHDQHTCQLRKNKFPLKLGNSETGF